MTAPRPSLPIRNVCFGGAGARADTQRRHSESMLAAVSVLVFTHVVSQKSRG